MTSVEDALQSSQSFVRALKSATDPPYEHGPSKIEIARMAWDSQSFYVSRKSDLILEWILTRFHKEKSKRDENPLLNIAYWSLLADILETPNGTHIVPLISRISLPALLASYIPLYASVPLTSRAPLQAAILRSLNFIWPIAVQRAGIDSLSECLWSALPVVDHLSAGAEDGLAEILTLIFVAFQTAFNSANAAGKKKAYLALAQRQLQSWLHAMHSLPATHPSRAFLYSIGTDILLSPDSLRASLDNNPNASVINDISSTLFGLAVSSNTEACHVLLDLLPRIYKDYNAALRKHRSVIFIGTPTSQQGHERLRRPTMRFGEACLVFLKNAEMEQRALEFIWAVRVGVLSVIEDDAVFDYAEDEGATAKFNEIGKDALKFLDLAWDESQSPLATHAMHTLSCLHRIEPNIVSPLIPQILARLATCSAAINEPCFTFLSQLNTHHSKTRTLHTLVSQLLSAVTSSFHFLPVSDAQTIYELCTRSPLLSLPFADELANALRTFLTPGQADEAVRSINEALAASWPTFETSEEPAKKRRKVSDIGEEMQRPSKRDDHVTGAIAFALVARLGATALGAVLRGPNRSDAERRRVCLKSIDGLISHTLEITFEAVNDRPDKIARIARGKRTRRDEDLQFHQYLCAALLRLWYDLFAQSGAPGLVTDQSEPWNSPGLLDRMIGVFVSCMRDEDTYPELQLEIGRVLYSRVVSLPQVDRNLNANGWPALNAVMDYVEANLFNSDTGTENFQEGSAGPAKRNVALALWSLTMERYLASIDVHASQAQLDRLARMMLRAGLNTPRPGQQKPSPAASVLARALTSASFWELCNIRTSVLAALDTQTVGFASVDTTKWLTTVVNGESKTIKALSKTSGVSWDEIETGIEVYRLLHYFPPDYLSRASRIELAKRALAADILIRVLSPEEEPGLPGPLEWRAVLRSFVVIVTRQTLTKIVDEMTSTYEWIPYLTLASHAPAQPTKVFVSSTLDLLFLIHKSAALAAVKTDGTSLVKVLTHFVQYNPFVSKNIAGERLSQQSLLRFVETFCREFKLSSFSEDVSRSLQRLCGDFDGALKPAIGAMARRPIVTDFAASANIIKAWQTLLALKRWLSIEQDKTNFGEPLLVNTARIIHSRSSDAASISEEFRATILSLLVEQGKMLSETDSRHAKIITAAYLLFTKSKHIGASACDAVMVSAIKLSSITHFETVLKLVADALEKETDETELISLIHLSIILLREAPERTSKLLREHAARCLRIFVNRPAFAESTSTLAAHVLDFIHSQCSERTASLKTSDAASIWSIMSRALKGCHEHDKQTSTTIFQTMVSILNVLVRLRRDLLGPHLPQLSMVLRQLILAIRAVRPLLGIKQHRIVSDTLPRWVNPACPLGKTEARSLARLLTALTTKSLVRNYGSNEGQKAESLARPFARHAPYVLLAYLQLMNDSLSVLSITIRHELEPGLFALCGMMGEHGRDTLMVQSLDVGGRVLLKSLWKEYDKQRYIGRG